MVFFYFLTKAFFVLNYPKSIIPLKTTVKIRYLLNFSFKSLFFSIFHLTQFPRNCSTTSFSLFQSQTQFQAENEPKRKELNNGIEKKSKNCHLSRQKKLFPQKKIIKKSEENILNPFSHLGLHLDTWYPFNEILQPASAGTENRIINNFTSLGLSNSYCVYFSTFNPEVFYMFFTAFFKSLQRCLGRFFLQ